MDIRTQHAVLQRYGSVMALNPPAAPAALVGFEEARHTALPPALRELLACFNGGEIFIPGTIIYGVDLEGEHPLTRVNTSSGRFSLPEQYLVFAKLNFGDLIAINTNAPYDVIQWDHELDQEFDRWDSLEVWLDESIQEYEAYMEEQS